MNVLAIDPGSKGALALLNGAGAILALHDLPTLQVEVNGKRRTRINPHSLGALVLSLHLAFGIGKAVIERVSARPGEGTASSFAFGLATGICTGAIATLGIDLATIPPATWKRALNLSADKHAARQAAMARWPDRAEMFKRVKDDGRAEAALLGLHVLSR